MWKSSIMQEWQSDRDCLDSFVERELPEYECLIADSERLSDEDRKEILSGLASRLDEMIALPEKWNGYSTLQRKLAEKTEAIASFRNELGSSIECRKVKRASSSPQKNPVSLLMKYYSSRGIIGEEALCILQTICATSGLHFGIEGPSGSGKTFVVNSLLDLLPSGSVFSIGADSDTAVYYDAGRINNCRFVYIPELQKAMQGRKVTVEFIKDLAEGKSSTRRVKEGKETKEYTVEAGKTVIYTLARENRFAKDIETERRMVVLHTSTSAEHVRNVIREKTCGRFDERAEPMTEAEIIALKMHVAKSLALGKPKTKDPFAEHISEYIPALGISAGLVERYYNVLDAYAGFSSEKRLRQGDSLFLNLEDHYMAFQLYMNDFVSSLYEMRGKGDTDIAKEVNNMSVDSALEKAQKEVNWEMCWNEGLKKMKKSYPSLADKWVEMNTVDGCIGFYDPLEGGCLVLDKKSKSRIAKLAFAGAVSILCTAAYFLPSSYPKEEKPQEPAHILSYSNDARHPLQE